MFLAAFALAQTIQNCAPGVETRTMEAIVQVESGGNPLALHDNTYRQSFAPRDLNEGATWANMLLALGHSLDIGLSQINSSNLGWLGLSVRDAFDPCRNLRGGSTILAYDYRAASDRFGPGQYALRRALGAYNTGSLFAGADYINRILAAAGIPADDPPVAAPRPAAPRARARRPVAARADPPAYTIQRTPGSPVVVIVGAP
jgi:type IV secretion system protein VirB1